MEETGGLKDPCQLSKHRLVLIFWIARLFWLLFHQTYQRCEFLDLVTWMRYGLVPLLAILHQQGVWSDLAFDFCYFRACRWMVRCSILFHGSGLGAYTFIPLEKETDDGDGAGRRFEHRAIGDVCQHVILGRVHADCFLYEPPCSLI